MSEMENKELWDKLNNAQLIDKLKNQKEFQILKKIARRIVDRAVNTFALQTRASETEAVIELQVIIKKWKFELFAEIEQMQREGKQAFDMLNEDGQINT